jgi:DNA anti-recombination protein RmuC
MTIQIETSLQQILERLEQKIDRLDAKVEDKINKLDAKFEDKIDKLDAKVEQKMDKLNVKVDELTIKLTQVQGDIKALEEKTEGLSKRIDATEFINRGIFVGLMLAILGGFAKLFGLVGNP